MPSVIRRDLLQRQGYEAYFMEKKILLFHFMMAFVHFARSLIPKTFAQSWLIGILNGVQSNILII